MRTCLTLGMLMVLIMKIYGQESTARWLDATARQIEDKLDEVEKALPEKRVSQKSEESVNKELRNFVADMRQMHVRLGDDIGELVGDVKQLEKVRNSLQKRTSRMDKAVKQRCNLMCAKSDATKKDVPSSELARTGLKAMRTASREIMDGLKNARGTSVARVALDVYEDVVQAATRLLETVHSDGKSRKLNAVDQKNARWLDALTQRTTQELDEAVGTIGKIRSSKETDAIIEDEVKRFVADMRQLHLRIDGDVAGLGGNKRSIERARNLVGKRSANIAREVNARFGLWCNVYRKSTRSSTPVTDIARSALETMRDATVEVMEGLKVARGDTTKAAMDVHQQMVAAAKRLVETLNVGANKRSTSAKEKRNEWIHGVARATSDLISEVSNSIPKKRHWQESEVLVVEEISRVVEDLRQLQFSLASDVLLRGDKRQLQKARNSMEKRTIEILNQIKKGGGTEQLGRSVLEMLRISGEEMIDALRSVTGEVTRSVTDVQETTTDAATRILNALRHATPDKKVRTIQSQEVSARWLDGVARKAGEQIDEVTSALANGQFSPKAQRAIENEMKRMATSVRQLNRNLDSNLRYLEGDKRSLQEARQSLEKCSSEMSRALEERKSRNSLPIADLARSGLETMRDATQEIMDGLKNVNGQIARTATEVFAGVVVPAKRLLLVKD